MTIAAAGALDARLEHLLRERFDAVVARFPVFATYLGIHEHDERLADGTREAVEQDIAEARRFLAELEAVDEADLSPYWRVEREVALLATRRQLWDDEVHRLWERRLSAADELGDGIFLLFARGTRPLVERLVAIRARLEAAPHVLEQQRSRLGSRPMRLWNELELESANSLPALFDEVVAAAQRESAEEHAEARALERAVGQAVAALSDYTDWLRGQLASADDEFALGPERYDELIRLRAFDGLGADDILEIGYEQLAEQRAARLAVAREIDPSASEQDVLARVKSNHPADFESALEAYRRAMDEARTFVIEQGIASLPPGEDLTVTPTPEYLRSVMPFAAYFSPAKFEPGSQGIYVVTPSVDGDPRALREHNYASIYNTGIHEAYPGHHQQLSAAMQHPSLARLLVDAPEFVEGWAMYCEQMMREEGFDTAPDRRLMMHTDAIWRACRIVLDVRLQRGQISPAEATEFLIEQTGFERPNATAEVNRYTFTPTYPLSYLLGKVLLLRLRADEHARLGDRFSLRAFHDALLREGSLPISLQRRLLQGESASA